MHTVRIRRKIESETLHLPELKPLLGKTVEIIIEERRASPKSEGVSSGAEATAMDTDCFQFSTGVKPLDAADKEALRALLTPAQHEALVDVVKHGGPNVEAIRKLRAAKRK